jgi:hypothetical protein
MLLQALGQGQIQSVRHQLPGKSVLRMGDWP